MNERDHKTRLRDMQSLESRLERTQFEDQPDSLFKDGNSHSEIADRTRAAGFSGIGAIVPAEDFNRAEFSTPWRRPVDHLYAETD